MQRSRISAITILAVALQGCVFHAETNVYDARLAKSPRVVQLLDGSTTQQLIVTARLKPPVANGDLADLVASRCETSSQGGIIGASPVIGDTGSVPFDVRWQGDGDIDPYDMAKQPLDVCVHISFKDVFYRSDSDPIRIPAAAIANLIDK